MPKERDASVMKKRPYILPLLIVASVVLPIISLNVGFFVVAPKEVFSYLFFGSDAVSGNVAIIIRNIRIPRICGAFIIGMGLAVSGTAYQSSFRNPLVSDNIIGVSHGAGLGAAIALMLRLNSFSVQVFAFLGGIITVGIAYLIGSRARFNKDVSLVLAGSMLSALANSMITMLKYLADPNDTLPAITYWLMGSLSKVNMRGLLFSVVPILVGCVILFLMRWRLNILTLGDEEAMSVGINPGKTRVVSVMAATVICSAAVCLGGQIGWVGLMIPHVARGLVGSDHRRMLPVAALTGGCFLLLMDNIARSVSTMEIPIGVLTSFFGAPFFIALLVRRKRG